MALSTAQKSPVLMQGMGHKSLVLCDHIPHLQVTETIRRLSSISDDDLILLKTGGFGSLAFDVIFSPGIVPKKREPAYRKAYTEFFSEIYDLDLFDRDDMFVFPDEENFYFDPKTGPNDDRFLLEWVSNLRAVAILLQSFRPHESATTAVSTNLIEAALCRMAENGEPWPDNLFYALPYPMQERLDTLRRQINKEIADGRTLAPRQFFQMANELEFKERDFLRRNIHDRVDMVIDQITGRQTLLPTAPGEAGLQFDFAVDWHSPTDRQFRQVNLSALMGNLEQAQKWTHLLLGTRGSATLPICPRHEFLLFSSHP